MRKKLFYRFGRPYDCVHNFDNLLGEEHSSVVVPENASASGRVRQTAAKSGRCY